MKNQADQSPKDNVSTGGTAASVPGAGNSRRRFIKGGAAAAPVILTFTSRPVLGFEQACMSPSRMISGNHSGFAGPVSCLGETRAYWKSQADLPSQDKPEWTNWFFTGQNGIFGNTYPYEKMGQGDNPNKLGPVLLDSFGSDGTNGTDGNTPHSVPGFASYIIAAYLNALYEVENVGTVLKPAQVVHMWNDVIGTGEFRPQLTMGWNATGVIGYLTNSGIVPA